MLNKFLFLLNYRQKIDGFLLIFYMIIGSVLEAFSIGAIIPLLDLLINNNFNNFPIFNNFFSVFFANYNYFEMINIIVLFIIILFFVKMILMIFISWKNTYFATDLQKVLSQKMIDGYLNQSYEYHLSSNTANHIKNATNEAINLSSISIAAGTFISELLILITISCLLFFYAPVTAFSVLLIFIISSFIFYKFTKTKILKWGNEREKYDFLRIKLIQHSLGAFKDIKILDKIKQFSDQYSIHNIKLVITNRKHIFLQTIPKLYLEFIAIVCVSFLILSSTLWEIDSRSLIVTLGVFVAAAFRLLPSTTRVLGAYQLIRFYKPTILLLYKEINGFNKQKKAVIKKSEKIIFNNNIIIKDLSYKYPGSEKFALNNINLEIKKGSTIGMIGKSGSGKTTLINILLGLLPPSNGKILVDNIDLLNNIYDWQKKLGFVPQNIFLFNDTIINNISLEFDEKKIDLNKLNKSIENSELNSFLSNLPLGYNTIIGERGINISGGQLQRIGIARAIYRDPDILILDEATNSLDGETEKKIIMNTIEKFYGKKTIIIISHRLSVLKKCNKIFNFENGNLIEDN